MSNEDPDVSDATSRLSYLRAHGIEVETPEDRSRAAAPAPPGTREVKYVYLPADRSIDAGELTFFPPDGAAPGGDALPSHLRHHFTASGRRDVDGDTLASELSKGNPLLSGGGADLPKVTPASLEKVVAPGNVESFPLCQPSAENGATSVRLYIDEIGAIKDLPVNQRAADLARAAGYDPPPVFHGDVFVGRSAAGRNVDFPLSEAYRDAAWLRSAFQDNLAAQRASNPASGTETQKGADGTDGDTKPEDGFAWTQTEAEVEVIVPAGGDVRAKDVRVTFKPSDTVVKVRGVKVVHVETYGRIDPDGCTWTLEAGSVAGEKNVVISCEKAEEAIWPRIAR